MPPRTLTLAVCEAAASALARDGASEAAVEYAAALRDCRQAFACWFAETGRPPPSSPAAYPAISMIVRNIPDAAIPADYARSSHHPHILVHAAFRHLKRPGFVLGHELVHLRNPQLSDEIGVCRRHVLELPRRALEIVALCRQLQSRGERLYLRQLAVAAQMDPATLNNHRRHPLVEEAVRAVLPVPVGERLEAALAAEEEASRQTSLPFTRAAVARRAGLNEKTVVADPVFARRVTDAIHTSELRWQAAVMIRIDRALQTLLDEWRPFSLADIARRAGFGADLLGGIRTWSPLFHDALTAAASGSLARAVTHALEAAERDGTEVTQKHLAERLGVSEASVSAYKDRPGIGDLLQNGLAFGAVARIRNAVADLVAEGIAPVQEAVAERAGVHQSTVSRAMARHPDLAAAIPPAAPESRARYPDPTAVRTQLALRQTLYGGECGNTAAALRRPVAQGGDPALFEACQRLGISLPRAQRAPRAASSGWLTAYLRRTAEMRLPNEAAAAALCALARAGDRTQMEALVVALRPLVRTAIASDLHEELDPAGFKAELLEHLVRTGDELIVAACRSCEGRGAALSHFHRTIADGLRQARRDFYLERHARHRRTLSLDAPWDDRRETDAPFTLAQTLETAARDLSPALVAEILDPAGLDEAAELVSRRDAAWGLPVVRAHDKAAVATALGRLLTKQGFPAAFEQGLQRRWALYLGGSMGRLGSALQGHGGLEFYVLTDGTELFAQDLRRVLRDLLRTSVPIRALLSRFGVRLPRAGEPEYLFAGGLDIAPGALLPGFAGAAEELLFQIAGNGILVAESESGAGRQLVRGLTSRLADSHPEDAARALVSAREEFLTRERLKQAVRYFPGTRRVREVRWNGWIHEYAAAGPVLRVRSPDGNGACEVGSLVRRMKIGAAAGDAPPPGGPMDTNCFYGVFAGCLRLKEVPIELLAGRLCLQARAALAALRAQDLPLRLWSQDPVQVAPHRFVAHVSARREDAAARPLAEIEPLLTAEHFFGARLPRLAAACF
jgi:hypothetical protein